jgi:hypothetical protein
LILHKVSFEIANNKKVLLTKGVEWCLITVKEKEEDFPVSIF